MTAAKGARNRPKPRFLPAWSTHHRPQHTLVLHLLERHHVRVDLADGFLVVDGLVQVDGGEVEKELRRHADRPIGWR